MIHAEDFVEGMRAQIVTLGYANVQKHGVQPTMDGDVWPMINVTWTSDKAPSRGGPRTGNPTFDHTTTLIVEVIDKANDGIGLRTKLSAHGQALMSLLLSDLGWGGEVLEGIAQVHQQVDLPIEGNFTLGRLQIGFEALSNSSWFADAAALPDFGGADVRTTDALPGLGTTITIP